MAVLTPLRIALKEWAAVCLALASGRQAVLLRKGGINEPGGGFRAEHPRFWLYPTWVHQQETGLAPEAKALLAQAEKPAAGAVALSLVAEAARVKRLATLDEAQALGDLHVLSAETVASRFAYREPGLTALAVRVYKVPARAVNETPAYAGCKSWVELDEALDPGEGVPALDDEAFAAVLRRLH